MAERLTDHSPVWPLMPHRKFAINFSNALLAGAVTREHYALYVSSNFQHIRLLGDEFVIGSFNLSLVW